jgi:hypothetical protein
MRLLKGLVLLMLLAVITAIISPFLLKTHHPIPNSSIGPNTKGEPLQSSAENPRFYGVDAKKQPYVVQAKYAIQLQDKTLDLDQVFAHYTLQGEEMVSVMGSKANLNSDANIVNIKGDVVILYDDLYSLNAQNAELNYKDGEASGNSDVILTSKLGKVEAANFEIKENYSDIKFFGGRVKTTLYPRESEDGK